MTVESLIWFCGQAAAMIAATLVGHWLGGGSARGTRPVAIAAVVLMVAGPLGRLRPDLALRLLPVEVLVFAEVTAVAIPAALLFAMAARQIPKAGDRRALRLLPLVCAIFFVNAGLWMVRPPVPEMRSSHYADGVCRQSTDYTCVAASLVTVLQKYGIETSEGEMARLSYTGVGQGTTDTRAVLALQRKLAGQPLDARYEPMDYARLQQVGLPCLVPLKWGYFVSHMVAVLEVGDDAVVLGDPLTGARRVSRREFEREWLRRGIHLVERE